MIVVSTICQRVFSTVSRKIPVAIACIPPSRFGHRWLAAALCCAVSVSYPAVGRSDDRAQVEFFEKSIRPVLIQSCYECHSGLTAEPRGDLRLDSREAVRRGGESGPVLVPGRPEESLLISALRHESLQMPPDDPLSGEVIADFVRWIQLGAPDPRDQPDSTIATSSWTQVLQSRRDWWSLQPVVEPVLPETPSDWGRVNADRFILAQLQASDLWPAESATPQQLIRRLTLVLTGLPPTPDEVAQYLRADRRDADAAYELLVDRLLGSPRFGERWARHWMDVVRYTETHGNEWNYEVHHAWRYRDYLIRALNVDVPYDRLVQEHIAGDLLEFPRWDQDEGINESVIGTSFYRFGEVNHDDCVTLTSLGYDILDNQIDTLAKAFQATTIACARCHHHKIDAVSMQDYYALLGVLKSARLTAHTIDAATVNAEPMERLRQLKARIKHEVVRHWGSQAGVLARYLLAADAEIRQSAAALELAQGLDHARLAAWAAALKVRDVDVAHPLWAWQQFGGNEEWDDLKQTFFAARREQLAFNRDQFVLLADFSTSDVRDWRATGQGLREGNSPSGEFTVAHEGDNAIASLLPAGRFTHLLSQKLNGTLRSPVLPAGSKQVSALVIGDKTSAIRLVSNNCQLNYANYRALTSSQPTWVTFRVPADSQTLNTFAELVTKFDNPKFPDQLGTLGGDRSNDRVPWSVAAADPRSYFGVMQVVLHEGAPPPQTDLSSAARLFDYADAVRSKADLAERYTDVVRRAVNAWAAGKTSDEDVYWLAWVVQHELLDHSLSLSPRLSELVREYRSIEAHEIQQPRLAAGVADFGDGRDHPLFERGDHTRPGDTVPRRYLEVLADGQRFATGGSGRLQLAETIASSQNPLTGRVMVNRVWHYMFGKGIVGTVDDFGRVGELPSHPALLDYLTARFTKRVERGGMGWSIKQLVREIALSATFRMSSRPVADALSIDPQNRMLHHYPARRMEAEVIRDSILAICGRLDGRMYGMSVQPYRDKTNEYRRLFAGPLDGDGRRSIYIKVNLMEGPRFLGAFNVPGGKITQGRRDVTNLPTQALTMLNDPFVRQQSEVWASELIDAKQESVPRRLEAMFQSALGRAPARLELDQFRSLVDSLAQLHGVSDVELMSHRAIWVDVAHVFFNLKEFIYVP